MNSMKRQKDRTLKDELPRLVGAQWDSWMASLTQFEQARGVGDGQWILACCSPRGCKDLDTTEWLNWTGLYNPWNSPGQDTGVGSRSLLQGIFPTQGSNSGLQHCRQILLPAEPPENPKNTGVGSLSLLQGIFPTQELKQGLLHHRQILYQLSSQGSPRNENK